MNSADLVTRLAVIRQALDAVNRAGVPAIVGVDVCLRLDTLTRDLTDLIDDVHTASSQPGDPWITDPTIPPRLDPPQVQTTSL